MFIELEVPDMAVVMRMLKASLLKGFFLKVWNGYWMALW